MEREYYKLHIGMYYDILKVVKNSNFVSTNQGIGVVENKDREIWTKEDKEKVQHNLKSKYITIVALGIDEFFVYFSF